MRAGAKPHSEFKFVERFVTTFAQHPRGLIIAIIKTTRANISVLILAAVEKKLRIENSNRMYSIN